MEKIFFKRHVHASIRNSRSCEGSSERRRLSAGGRGASVRSNMWGARVSVGSSVAERNGRNSLLAPVCAVGHGEWEGGREGGDVAAR